MAITRMQKDALTDIQVGRDTHSPLEGDVAVASRSRTKAEKKPGFIATTIEELRKVEWPSARYTFNWSLVIIIFTILISLFMGIIDHTFTSGIRFATCTSTLTEETRESGFRECVNTLGQDLLLRNGIL